jgi:hypothetical protein
VAFYTVGQPTESLTIRVGPARPVVDDLDQQTSIYNRHTNLDRIVGSMLAGVGDSFADHKPCDCFDARFESLGLPSGLQPWPNGPAPPADDHPESRRPRSMNHPLRSPVVCSHV